MKDWAYRKRLVDAVMDMTAAARRRWLEANCDKPDVREWVNRAVESLDEPIPVADAVSEAVRREAPKPKSIGRYRILREIGRGGSCVVYLAQGPGREEPVALKCLSESASHDPENRKRLLWDGRVAASLRHPNIVRVYEMGAVGARDYVAMEYVPGATLRDVLSRSPLDEALVAEYALGIAAGIEAAHQGGFAHRDLKPENVIVGEDGRLKLLDFGLAKPTGGQNWRDKPETIRGRFGGTAAYVSPEQAEGLEVDARTDIFSFGSVLYEMLTGKVAFSAGNALAGLARVVGGEPEPLEAARPGLAKDWGPIVRRCLEKRRERRFQTMGEARAEIGRIVR